MKAPRGELSFADAVLLTAGSMIGAGIFIAPNLVARQIGSGPWMMAAWAGGGLLSLLGALVFAELGAMFPATGGQYVYLREAFGKLPAFLFGWSCLLTIYSAAIAWMAVSFAIWLGQFADLSEAETRAAAMALIAVSVVVNTLGLKLGARAQDGLTALKLIALAGITFVCLLAPARAVSVEPAPGAAAFGVALIGCLLSFDGWSNAGLMAGEMRDAQKNLPRALVAGVALVLVAYLAANLAYLNVMTPAEIGAAERVAAQAMERAAGPGGGRLVAGAILLSSMGVCLAWMISAPRLYYAMARDGCFFAACGRLHPRYGTPANAICLQGVVAAALAATGAYQALASFAMFAAWCFYVLATLGLFRLRRTRPELARPYRVPGYPLTPALFLLAALAFVFNTLKETPRPALLALSLMLAGIPAFRYWSRNHG